MKYVLVRWFTVAALAGILVPAAASAETVRLRSGDLVEGKVADAGDRIQVTMPSGTLSVRWRDVDVVLRDRTAAEVLRDDLAKADPKDAAALYALSLRAERAGLGAERRACLEAALAADPEHEAARAALAQQKSDGKWLEGSALLAAKGFVARDGAWVLREEAESLERRAEAVRALTPDEKRAEAIFAKIGDGPASARKFAIEALRGLQQEELLRPALRALRRGVPAAREVAARALGVVRDVDVVRPLVYAAIMDREEAVRAGAVASLPAIAAADIVTEDVRRPFARALWSEIPAVRMNAAEALGAMGGVASVEWVLRRVQTGGGTGGRNHFFAGTQMSYISDFDVEIAQAAQIGDPIVGTIREGVILDTRVLAAREEFTVIERRVFYRALARATGKDYGEDWAAWQRWFDESGRAEMTAAR